MNDLFPCCMTRLDQHTEIFISQCIKVGEKTPHRRLDEMQLVQLQEPGLNRQSSVDIQEADGFARCGRLAKPCQLFNKFNDNCNIREGKG